MEREKAGLELRVGTCEAQAAAYCATIDHLKSELAQLRPSGNQVIIIHRHLMKFLAFYEANLALLEFIKVIKVHNPTLWGERFEGEGRGEVARVWKISKQIKDYWL